MSSEISAAFNKFQQGFTYVLAALQQEGVAHADGHTALGISKESYGGHVLGSAIAGWNITHSPKDIADRDEKNLFVGFASLLAACGNFCETLDFSGQDRSADASFACIGVSRKEFEAEYRGALVRALAKLSTDPMRGLTQYGHWFTYDDFVTRTLNYLGISPENDDLFREAGYESSANFHTKWAEWQAAVAQQEPKQQGGCCSVGEHNHS